jgi:aminoglycoside phosphotransferase (APT) family kinase protein
VIGILDWELTTLGSPLADLGNVLLPFSFRPVDTSSLPRRKGESSLMMGLKDLSSDESGLPVREELERWWVEGMNEGVAWQRYRAGHWGQEGVARAWSWPIQGMG